MNSRSLSAVLPIFLLGVPSALLAQSEYPATAPATLAGVRDPLGPITPLDLATGNIDIAGDPVHDNPIITFGIFDRLEWRSGEGRDGYLFDAFAFTGGDYNRLWIELEGEGLFNASLEAAEVQVLYNRAITPYWNFQAGFRHDFKPKPELTYGVIGFEGLNVYWSGIETNLYVSEDGDVSADFEVEYDEFLTQRLVLQPRFEAAAQAQNVEELSLGSGFTGYEVGLRLRYEIKRELAPYVGVSWTETIGETADMLPASEDASKLSAVAGLRIWF